MDVWFDRVDANHDGKLTLAEMEADAVRQFNVMDLRHDGKVTVSEVAAYRERVMGNRYASFSTPEIAIGRVRDTSEEPRVPGETRHRDDDSQPRPDTSGVMPADRPDPVMSADTDLDGSVTLDEFKTYVHQNFADLDRSHAGSIEKGDLHRLCKDDD